jgi:hypothetical protein
MRKLLISGDEVILGTGWSIMDVLNARSSLSAEIISSPKIITSGESVVLMQDEAVIFSGVVLTVSKSEALPGQLIHSIKCVDNSALADRRLVFKGYVNISAGNIVRDLIQTVLSLEGVTPGIIDDGPMMTAVKFNYITATDALDLLKSQSGLNWRINNDKTLDFISRASDLAPFSLTNDVQHSGFRHESDMEKYRNREYVRGGLGRTAIQVNWTPTPAPDGQSRTFFTRYPIAEKPVIEINTGSGWVAVNPNDIGVNGLDTGKKYYFSYGSTEINQDTSESVLVAGNLMRLTYYGLRRIFVLSEDPAQIAGRKTEEPGTSGVFERIDFDNSLVTQSAAIDFANSKLETFGKITDSVTYSTYIQGLRAGQLQQITKPLFGIDEQFLIESITIRPDGNDLVYSVKALDGASIGGWEVFFKTLARRQAEYVIAENEVLILLVNFTEGITFSESLEVMVTRFPSPADDLYYLDANPIYSGIGSIEVII